MRKEDKLLLPPRLKVKLLQGFHIKRAPREYRRYYGTGDRRVCPRGG